tara:strand:- start:89 stop:628 length:540 start_codon:yes stop_codon:yes gene_type:complete
MIRYFIIFLIFGNIYPQNKNNDHSPIFDSLFYKSLNKYDLKLILIENEDKVFEKYIDLNIINESIQLITPKYDRFSENNSGFLLPIKNYYSSLYIDSGFTEWINASTYVMKNNEIYSSGFFNSSLDKFSYFNSKKGFMDIDNYFKDPWDQRSADDYLRYIHSPPILNHSEINTIYDTSR